MQLEYNFSICSPLAFKIKLTKSIANDIGFFFPGRLFILFLKRKYFELLLKIMPTLVKVIPLRSVQISMLTSVSDYHTFRRGTFSKIWQNQIYLP